MLDRDDSDPHNLHDDPQHQTNVMSGAQHFVADQICDFYAVLWIQILIRSDPKLFAGTGSGSVIINFGSGSDKLVLISICKLPVGTGTYRSEIFTEYRQL